MKIPLGPSPQNEWHVSDDEADLVRRPRAPLVAEIAGEPQRVRIDLRRTACIVVDMQNDFCSLGGWLDHIGVDITPVRRPIAPLQRILPQLRRTGVPVIWLNWGNRPDRLNLSPSLLHVYKPSGRGVGLGDPLPKTLTATSWLGLSLASLRLSRTTNRRPSSPGGPPVDQPYCSR